MSVLSCLEWTAKLLSWAMMLQGAEIFYLTKQKQFLKVWSLANLRGDLSRGLPFSNSMISWLFSVATVRLFAILQLMAAMMGVFHPHLSVFVILFFTHLYLCLRFRGTFNGGSDMMTFVVLTGILVAQGAVTEKWQQLGLIYIALHCFFSYLKAGIVKVVNSDWKKGLALPAFLDRSIYLDMKKISAWLQQKTILKICLCWLVIVFELSIVGILVFPRLAPLYFIAALMFHFSIYIAFGLNRFFWIWLSAWPSMLYVSALLI